MTAGRDTCVAHPHPQVAHATAQIIAIKNAAEIREMKRVADERRACDEQQRVIEAKAEAKAAQAALEVAKNASAAAAAASETAAQVTDIEKSRLQQEEVERAQDLEVKQRKVVAATAAVEVLSPLCSRKVTQVEVKKLIDKLSTETLDKREKVTSFRFYLDHVLLNIYILLNNVESTGSKRANSGAC